MQIPFNLPHVFNPYSSRVENAYVLRALLDCLVRVDIAYLKRHSVPRLYRSGVVYGRTTLWEPIPALYARHYGDCKSLSCALIAEYTLRGIKCQPTFRWHKSGDNTDYHILVQTINGFEDPSKKLGMSSEKISQYTL